LPGTVPKATSRRQWLRQNALAVFALIVICLCIPFVALLLRPILSLSPTNKDSAPVLAATIALTGVLTTALIALIGHILKQGVDNRNYALAVGAARRAEAEQHRQVMELSVDTVRLLATSSGEPSPIEQVSAALIVLARLEQLDLALDLALELFPMGRVSPSAIMKLCDLAFAQPNRPQQVSAALLLRKNWRLLRFDQEHIVWLEGDGVAWPDTMLPGARSIVCEGIREWITEVPPESGGDFRTHLLNQ
jgi:hypothetical protein